MFQYLWIYLHGAKHSKSILFLNLIVQGKAKSIANNEILDTNHLSVKENEGG